MDTSVDVPHGPHAVRPNSVVSVPRALLREIGVVSGQDSVHWALNPAMKGTLIMIPSEMVARAMPEILAALDRVSS